MDELNPYAGYLDGRPLSVILAATPQVLAALLAKIGPEKSATAPAPGKWSPAEILSHMADCELAFGFRLRQTLAEDHHVVQPYDQEKWAAAYAGVPADAAFAAFAALRAWNLLLLGAALPAAAGKPVTHPERGAITFLTIVETIAGHDLNHIGQMRRIAGELPSA